jgi:hypothetical protein
MPELISKWLLHLYRGYGSRLLWCFISEEKMVLNRVVIIERIICRETMQSVKIEYLMKKNIKDKSPLLKRTVMQLLKVRKISNK